MEENMNKRPRPRRNVEAVNSPAASSEAKKESMAVPTPVNMPRPEEIDMSDSAPIPNLVPTGNIDAEERAKAADEARARANAAKEVAAAEAQKPKAEDDVKKEEEYLRESAINSMNVAMQSVAANLAKAEEDDDSEKTRLTDIQPKAKLKTPIRKKKEDKKKDGPAEMHLQPTDHHL